MRTLEPDCPAVVVTQVGSDFAPVLACLIFVLKGLHVNQVPEAVQLP